MLTFRAVFSMAFRAAEPKRSTVPTWTYVSPQERVRAGSYTRSSSDLSEIWPDRPLLNGPRSVLPIQSPFFFGPLPHELSVLVPDLSGTHSTFPFISFQLRLFHSLSCFLGPFSFDTGLRERHASALCGRPFQSFMAYGNTLAMDVGLLIAFLRHRFGSLLSALSQSGEIIRLTRLTSKNFVVG